MIHPTDKYLVEVWFRGERDAGFLLSRYTTEEDEGIPSNRIGVQFSQESFVVSLLATSI